MSHSGRILASTARLGPEAEASHVRHARRGLVLCGGRSSRMGRDKALLELDGRTLVERATRVLELVAPEVWLACGTAARYGELGRRLVLDRESGAGPLAGIAAALDELRDGWLCVLACDMPRVTPALFERLLARAEGEMLDACLAATGKGLEPLCAVYHARCAGPVRAALARGERRMVGFWAETTELRVETLLVPTSECDPSVNLNTPEEYESERAVPNPEPDAPESAT